jgi:hypothetical protein
MSLDVEQPDIVQDSGAGNPDPASHELTGNEGDGLLETQQQPDPDEIEEEFEGLKLRGKKDILEEFKKGRMLHADYTRKTQELAEQRRSFDNEREESKRTRELHTQADAERFQLWSKQERFQQLQQVDFASLRQVNPDLAEQLRDEMTRLPGAIQQLNYALSQKLTQLEQSRQQDDAKLDRQLAEALQRAGWTHEKDVQLANFVQAEGLDPNAVKALVRQNPVALRILEKAAKFDQLEKQRTAKAPAAQPKPATRISGSGAANTKPLGEITDPREWAERRRQRKANNR